MRDIDMLRRVLTEPSAVAVIGASDDATKTAGRPLHFLRRHGFGGRVYPVNSRHATVQHEKAYGRIEDVPEPVDHAFIALPTDAAIQAARDCARAGVRLVTMLADGFAEAGPTGLARQQDLVRLVDDTGCRILGPNSLGLVRTVNALSMTANAAFAVDRLATGRYTVLSQSGSLIGTFYSRGRTRGIGFANLISVGNEADLSIGELGEALVDDVETDAFLLFLETIRHRDRLARFAEAAARAGKPVLAYKLGRSAVGSELAISHTGALAGSDTAANQLLRDLGISRVDVFETLLEAPPLFSHASRLSKRRPPTATIITTTGGGGAMVADRLGMLGVALRGADDALCARLAAQGITVRPGHIIDVTLAGTRYDTMHAIISELLRTDGIGAIVAVIGSSAEFFPDRALAPIVDAVKVASHDRPTVAVFTVPESSDALRLLADAGIAGFRTPEACADAIRAVLHPPVPRRPAVASLDAAAAAILDGAPERMNESEALALFAALGIDGPHQVVVAPDQIASLAVEALPAVPVVAKLLSRDIPHKSDIGAIALGLRSIDEIQAAAAGMITAAKAHAPEATIEGLLIQRQYTALAEVLVGYRHDAAAGPIVTLGLGGVLAELHRDFAVRIAPVDRDEALAMIDEVRGLAVLRGYRGRPRGDVTALADAIVQLSRLALHPRVTEAEINPLLVNAEGHGVVAVDGLVINETAQT